MRMSQNGEGSGVNRELSQLLYQLAPVHIRGRAAGLLWLVIVLISRHEKISLFNNIVQDAAR